jgi:hypothetical protein
VPRESSIERASWKPPELQYPACPEQEAKEASKGRVRRLSRSRAEAIANTTGFGHGSTPALACHDKGVQKSLQIISALTVHGL